MLRFALVALVGLAAAGPATAQKAPARAAQPAKVAPALKYRPVAATGKSTANPVLVRRLGTLASKEAQVRPARVAAEKQSRTQERAAQRSAAKAAKDEAFRLSPTGRAKALATLQKEDSILAGMRDVVKARNGFWPGSNYEAMWVLPLAAQRETKVAAGFAVDHTGLVFVFDGERLPVTPRLMARIQGVGASEVKAAIDRTAEALGRGAQPPYVKVKKAGIFHRDTLVWQMEQPVGGLVKLKESFRMNPAVAESHLPSAQP